MLLFSDLNIKAESQSFTGEKIKIDKLLNTPIAIYDYDLKASKVSDGECLYLQIEYKNEKRVVFTGSKTLAQMIKKVPKDKLPIKATIVKENDRYEFT